MAKPMYREKELKFTYTLTDPGQERKLKNRAKKYLLDAPGTNTVDTMLFPIREGWFK
jgi:hypothetical protein